MPICIWRILDISTRLDQSIEYLQVDTHVGKHLFEECIQRYLAGKTRILATHQLQYIKGVNGIILLDHGRMKYFETYHNLLAERPEYASLLATEGMSETGDDSSFEKSVVMRRQLSTSSTRVNIQRRLIFYLFIKAESRVEIAVFRH